MAEVNGSLYKAQYNQAVAALQYARAAKASLGVGDMTIPARKAAVKAAKTNLDNCKIVSPVKGIIINRGVNIGQTVAPAMSAVPFS